MSGIANFMIDPPWPKAKCGNRKTRPYHAKDLPYDRMDVPAIFALLDRAVLSRAAEPHNVWLWTIDSFLWEAERFMRQRDYKLHARLIWYKWNGLSPACTVRFAHEYLLWYYKPRLRPVADDQRGKFDTVLSTPSREHSRKPDIAYQMVEALYPGLPKLDVFSREKRPGWGQFGNQREHFRGIRAAGAYSEWDDE